MYYEYFGLKNPPFRITPETRLFYSGAERGDILNALIYAVSSGEAITKVVGEVGTGKTMLCRMLELKLPKHIKIAYLPNPNISPENILHAIAFEMGLPIASNKTANRFEVMKALEHYLLEKHAANEQVVVFVEEAQSMPLDSLEEIRLLSNLETQQYKLLQIVLFGQPELDENLSTPRVRQIKERITNSFYLQPLVTRDIRNYLMFRLHLAGYCGADVFTRGASSLIGRASRGLMRRINILADKAMLAAFSQDSKVVTRKHVHIAIRDSEFGHRWRRPQLAIVTAALSVLAFGVVVLATVVFDKRIDEGVTYVSSSQTEASPDKLSENPGSADQLSGPSSELAASEANHRYSGSDYSSEQLEPVNKTDITRRGPSNELSADETPQLAAEDNRQPELAATEIVESRMQQAVTWLEDRPPGHFSIQILLIRADAKGGLGAFFEKSSVRSELDKLYVVQSRMNGETMLGVFYGDFATYSEANGALRALPDALSRDKPYLRRIGVIKAEASQFTVEDESLG